MDAATSGRSSSPCSPAAAAYRWAMAATATAALPSTVRDTRLIPATSTTEYISVTSLAPTYGDTSPDAMVETNSFGKPTASPAITAAAIDDPPDPPAASTPWMRPDPAASAITAAAPRAIAATAAPRSS